MARALDIATFPERIVVASDLSEVLCVADDGEVVEDLGEVSAGLEPHAHRAHFGDAPGEVLGDNDLDFVASASHIQNSGPHRRGS